MATVAAAWIWRRTTALARMTRGQRGQLAVGRRKAGTRNGRRGRSRGESRTVGTRRWICQAGHGLRPDLACTRKRENGKRVQERGKVLVFICGILEPSDGPAAMVFLCNNATCGHFYHPKCVAQQLYPKNKSLEDRTQEELQFAVCRRCPKSYHRKCLPREIAFEDSENEDSITRAWELSKRILIYCLDHEIDTDIETPTRDHIKFPRIPNIDRPARILKNSVNVVAKKKKRSFSEEVPDQFAGLSDMALIQESHQARKTCARSSSEHFVDKPEKKKAKLLEVREQPEPYMVNDTIASSTKPVKDQEELLATMPSSNTRKIPQSSFPTVDNETESRVIALVEREAPYLTLKDVSRKLKMPSTYLYPGRKIDTIIATGKLEHSVQAVGAALKVLENGGNVNAAKAVCEPDVLKQLTKWHSKLSVYISPFIYGSRYSSFGRHFTKIVDKLHCCATPSRGGQWRYSWLKAAAARSCRQRATARYGGWCAVTARSSGWLADGIERKGQVAAQRSSHIRDGLAVPVLVPDALASPSPHLSFATLWLAAAACNGGMQQDFGGVTFCMSA
ncbi:hypothetical protein GUJ93_ZPchr0533g6555 [Zizania palustris]|uniref:Histone-lysine N-methyltransferase NSD-like PHD zinc finger domain-containing protein n=1 Tax=Zizania palustris TaxID=103762 RepID=A0A8J5R6I0_ZIZPA|nr:hypothetical protein GUJ93_ZPchr0533g6555 [Zizania palustris]